MAGASAEGERGLESRQFTSEAQGSANSKGWRVDSEYQHLCTAPTQK